VADSVTLEDTIGGHRLPHTTRIALISPFPLETLGGITRFVGDLSNAFRAMGNEVHVYEGSIRELQTPSRIVRDLFWALAMFIHVATTKPDVVHAHSHWATAIPGFLLKLLRVKHTSIFTFHTQQMRVPGPMKQFVLSSILSKYDCVSFVSASLAEAYGQILNLPEKGIVIHPCYRSFEVAESEAEKFRTDCGLQKDELTICFVGPLVWRDKVRGVRLLIKCFASLAKRRPGLRLLIVGDGPLRRMLEEYAGGLECADRVVFTGMIDNPGLPLAVSQVYAHISFQEGLPHSIIDAMVSSKAIVASRIGGIPEAITDRVEGLLVDNSEAHILRARETAVADGDLRSRLGGNARERALDTFSCEKMAQGFHKVYHRQA